MKKIFLDCGTHICEGLNEFIDKKIVDDTFEIHTFEPNPACNVKERLKNIPFDVILHEKAVWISDGKLNFRQENHKISKSKTPTDGTSDLDGWASSVDGLGFNYPGLESTIEVESISFSDFLENIPENSFVICKMDIEGSEFLVLRDLIEKNTITKINELYVEFHERYMKTESTHSRNEIVNKITTLGIKVHQWS